MALYADKSTYIVADYMFNGRYMSAMSYENLLRFTIDSRMNALYSGETFSKDQFAPEMQECLQNVEDTERIYLLEIIVGGGNNSFI